RARRRRKGNVSLLRCRDGVCTSLSLSRTVSVRVHTTFKCSILNEGQERRHPDWRCFATGVRICRQRSISLLCLPVHTTSRCGGKARTGTCILHRCSSL